MLHDCISGIFTLDCVLELSSSPSGIAFFIIREALSQVSFAVVNLRLEVATYGTELTFSGLALSNEDVWTAATLLALLTFVGVETRTFSFV